MIPKKPRKFHPLRLLFSITLCESAGVIGALATSASIPTWYAGLQKPLFNPPNWVFGPVWTALYFIMGWAFYRVWQKGFSARALAVFSLQLVMNLMWSIVFFGLHQPGLGLMELVLLWGLILWSILEFRRIDAVAGWLLAPYLAWVSFAGVLNYFVWQLNSIAP
jgi:tryptophan-rich sensory protein